MLTYLFLPGLGQTARSWAGVLEGLDLPGAVCPELTGCLTPGQADYPSLYRAFEADCLTRGRVHLCGLSLGAALALEYASEHPEAVASLALIAPQYKSPKALLRVQDMIFALMPEKAFWETGLGKADVRRLALSMGALDLTDRLGAVRCPTLVLCGEKDRANQKAARSLARLLPSAELRLVAGAGHEVNREAPAALAEILREFYQKTAL